MLGRCHYLVIANSHGLLVKDVLALNEGLDEGTTLHPGDEIIITVPEPELSVTSIEESTYEEDYYAWALQAPSPLSSPCFLPCRFSW